VKKAPSTEDWTDATLHPHPLVSFILLLNIQVVPIFLNVVINIRLLLRPLLSLFALSFPSSPTLSVLAFLLRGATTCGCFGHALHYDIRRRRRVAVPLGYLAGDGSRERPRAGCQFAVIGRDSIQLAVASAMDGVIL
jgi:hypothetical protein